MYRLITFNLSEVATNKLSKCCSRWILYHEANTYRPYMQCFVCVSEPPICGPQTNFSGRYIPSFWHDFFLLGWDKTEWCKNDFFRHCYQHLVEKCCHCLHSSKTRNALYFAWFSGKHGILHKPMGIKLFFLWLNDPGT